MSNDIRSGTSSRTAIVPSIAKYSSQKFVYIRPLRDSDKNSIRRLVDESEVLSGIGKTMFGVFDDMYTLVGIYETSDEAFEDAKESPFSMLWIQ